jgi:SAM-dependent methyltransferase
MSDYEVCDYEGSDYKARFWQNANRAYEDAVERLAINTLLPPKGRRIIEIGAGFGRLAKMYDGYDEIILLDYSRSLLRQAQEMWGHDARFKFVAASVYELPFINGVIDTALMIRVIHHIADVPAALRQIHKTMANDGCFILEFANKRNLKALLRYSLGKQVWNPNALEPIEFVKLNYDFHPDWMQQQLSSVGFLNEKRMPVSNLRIGLLKRYLPLSVLVAFDKVIQKTGMLYSPSIFTKNRAICQSYDQLAGDNIFCSPKSGGDLRRDGNMMICDTDGTRWRVEGNFYDFKEAL